MTTLCSVPRILSLIDILYMTYIECMRLWWNRPSITDNKIMSPKQNNTKNKSN
jgi:hypothetical protein